jgi:lysophospholipase L1-like esterase
MEICLRLYGYAPRSDLRSGRELFLRPSTDPDVKYELTPGISGEVWDTNVSVNSDGFRGPELRKKGPWNRIVLLGDSITFGNHLPIEQTYAAKLQALLESEDRGFEVINLALGGYDILQEVALLELRGIALQPNLVVVGYCLNDIGVASPNMEYMEHLLRRHSNPLFRSRLIEFTADRLDHRRQLNWLESMNSEKRFEKDYRGRIDRPESDEAEVLALANGLPDSFPGPWYRDLNKLGRLRYSLRRLSSLADRNGFSAVVMIIPFLTGERDTYPFEAIHHYVGWESRQAGLEVLDLADDLLRSDIDELKIFPKDQVHPNGTGHEIIARKLHSYIRQKTEKLDG